MKTSTIVLLGLGGAGAWWLWQNRKMITAPTVQVLRGVTEIDPVMAESYVRCTTAPGCSDAEYQNLRAYMFDLMNSPGLTQQQVDWVAERIVELDREHARIQSFNLASEAFGRI